MRKQVNITRVLIADQGSHTRLVLSDILDAAPGVEVAGTIADADDLPKAVKRLQPDVVLLNYSLPGNKNLFALQHIVSDASIPVLLLLKGEQVTSELLLKAANLGVYSFVCKPKPLNYPDYRSIADELVGKVKAVERNASLDLPQRLAGLMLEADKLLAAAEVPKPVPETVIVIGASTGGTKALHQLLKELVTDLNACVLIAVHMPDGFTKTLVQRLQRSTALTVKEGRAGLLLKPGLVIVAPGGRNMVVQPVLGSKYTYKIGFSGDQVPALESPSVDLLMQSVAATDIETKIGVILSGMGSDGTKGAALLYKKGGIIVAQDEASSSIFGMARSVIGSGTPHLVLPLPEIPLYLNKVVAQEITAGATGDSL